MRFRDFGVFEDRLWPRGVPRRMRRVTRVNDRSIAQSASLTLDPNGRRPTTTIPTLRRIPALRRASRIPASLTLDPDARRLTTRIPGLRRPSKPVSRRPATAIQDFTRQVAGQLGTLNKSQFRRLYHVVYVRAWNEVNAREKGRQWEAILKDVFVDLSANSQTLNISANVVATKAGDKKKQKWTVRLDVPSSLWGMGAAFGGEAQLKTLTVSHMHQGSDFSQTEKRWKLLKNGTMIHRATGWKL